MSGEILAAVHPVGGGMKLAALEQIVADLGLRGEDVMYVGDSITDAPPFAAVRRWGGVSTELQRQRLCAGGGGVRRGRPDTG